MRLENNQLTNKPKIVVLTHSYPRFISDWRSNFIESLAISYKKKFSSVYVVTPYCRGWKRNKKNSNGVDLITYRYMPFKSWHILGYGNSLKGDLKINILHLFLLPFLIFFGTIRLSALIKIHSVDIIHAHWAFPNSIIAVLAKYITRSNAKVFTSFPGSDVTVIGKLGFFKKVAVNLISKSDYLSCNSSDLKEDLIKFGIPKHKIDYVIYGVNAQKIVFNSNLRRYKRMELDVSTKEIMFLMVGRFVPKKGFKTAIKAMKIICDEFPNIKMFIIGDGDLKQDYVELIQSLHLEKKIIILGEVRPENLNAYYSASDVFLMPSERMPSDGLNVVVVEAMSCGRPILASSVGGNDLVVFDFFNGRIHSPGDHKDLAEKAKSLIENKYLREDMGKKSRLLVETKFNWDSIATYYLEKFKQINLRGIKKSQH